MCAVPSGKGCRSRAIFSHTGLPLERYELMHRIWWEEGIYA